MSIENLEKIFHPQSIAVIGASERQGSIGAALMRNLIGGGYEGRLYPINPRHRNVMQLPSQPAIGDVGEPVDLAIITTPISSAPQIVAECSAVGVGGVVIISAGGKEIGRDGHAVEAAIKMQAEKSGLRVIGPNCLGVVCSQSKVNASFASRMAIPGKTAFISQSGAICTAILDLSLQEHIGFSHLVSLGSMLDIDFGDMIDFLGGEPGVGSIVMYVENLTRLRKFMSAARAVSRIKPIIALKAGRTRAGALAAASHTGAMAGEDAVYDAVFERAGILRVKTFEELFDCAELVAKQPRPSRPNLIVITNAGGPAVMAGDALSDHGVEPAPLSETVIRQLNEILPPQWSKRNPIDMLGEATPEIFRQVVRICLQAEGISGMLIITAPQALTNPTDIASTLADQLKNTPFPVLTSWMGGAAMNAGRDIFQTAGIPSFDTPERAVRAFVDLYRYGRNIEILQQVPPRLNRRLQFDRIAGNRIIQTHLVEKRLIMTETASKALLAAYGIPSNPVQEAFSADEAVAVAEKTKYPVVMKVNSPEISHKSDVGGVCLDLRDANSVKTAFETIMVNMSVHRPECRVSGVTIQPMITRSDFELIVGAKMDRDFGPVVLFGTGGIVTEVFEDRALAIPPLNRLLARRLMENTRSYRLLQGYRNLRPANLESLEEILIRLAQLVIDHPQIEALDVNPLVVIGDGALALDARVLLKPTEIRSPLHLIISPYPDHQETHLRTSAGMDLFVRPIRPEDAPLLLGLFETLSERSIYRRFFTPIKRLSHSMLARFTQIDYDREIALIALPDAGPEDVMLGVARIIPLRNLQAAEFSVVVGDPWQGKGIGAALLDCCLEVARNRGLQKITGAVLAENIQMLALGRKLGFKIQRLPDVGEYELRIDLATYTSAKERGDIPLETAAGLV